jgi:predicted GTPase
MLHVGDYIKVNNMVKLVTSINYTTKIVTVNSNFTFAATGNVSLNKVLVGTGQSTQIFGPVGVQYITQLVTEAGDFLVTEDNNTLLIN